MKFPRNHVVFGLLLLTVSLLASAADTAPSIVVFYQDGCDSCAQLDAFLDPMLYEAPEEALLKIEVSEPNALQTLATLAKAYNIAMPSIYPIVFIGDRVIEGMSRANEPIMSDAITRCLRDGCESPMNRLPMSQIRADLPRLGLFLAAFLALAWFQLR